MLFNHFVAASSLSLIPWASPPAGGYYNLATSWQIFS